VRQFPRLASFGLYAYISRAFGVELPGDRGPFTDDYLVRGTWDGSGTANDRGTAGGPGMVSVMRLVGLVDEAKVSGKRWHLAD